MGWSGNLKGERESVSNKIGVTRRDALAFTAAGLAAAAAPGMACAAGPQEQLTWGVHISLAPTWFDPAETPGIITPFMVLYALHDAVVKPMPCTGARQCYFLLLRADEFEVRIIVERHRLLRSEIVRHSFQQALGLRFVGTSSRYVRGSSHRYYGQNRHPFLRDSCGSPECIVHAFLRHVGVGT